MRGGLAGAEFQSLIPAVYVVGGVAASEICGGAQMSHGESAP